MKIHVSLTDLSVAVLMFGLTVAMHQAARADIQKSTALISPCGPLLPRQAYCGGGNALACAQYKSVVSGGKTFQVLHQMDVLADKQRRSRLEITRRVRSISSLCIFYVTGDLEAKDRPGTAKALAYVWDTRLGYPACFHPSRASVAERLVQGRQRWHLLMCPPALPYRWLHRRG
jgi:hypothetical protein